MKAYGAEMVTANDKSLDCVWKHNNPFSFPWKMLVRILLVRFVAAAMVGKVTQTAMGKMTDVPEVGGVRTHGLKVFEAPIFVLRLPMRSSGDLGNVGAWMWVWPHRQTSYLVDVSLALTMRLRNELPPVKVARQEMIPLRRKVLSGPWL